MQNKHSNSVHSNFASSVQNVSAPNVEERRRMVAEAAYFRAEHYAFQGGDANDDWYRAEEEIDALLTKKTRRS